MVRGNKIIFGLLILSVVLILSGCERLKRWDAKLGEIFFSEEPATSTLPFWEDLGEMVKDRLASTSDRILDEVDIKKFVNELTKEQKMKIENWLEAEGFNRYGDPADTYYTGGTPLFNEETGETKERFEYILENHEDLIKELGL